MFQGFRGTGRASARPDFGHTPCASPLIVNNAPGSTLPSIDDLLTFWFAEPSRWWTKDPAFDAEVRGRFLALHAAVQRGECDHWLENSRGALAYVIVLDQLSRNMFRGSARMFEGDEHALAATRRALNQGFDRNLSNDERMFLYMPLMHS
jgi:uncharacterized protein (DUF924 family)